LIYGCGLYTAKEQGIVKKGVYFQNFFKAHYFDWILFAQRSFKYGIVGGLLIGTIVFGNVSLAFLRIGHRYNYYFSMSKPDPRGSERLYFPITQ
jgi:hypothetical protein